jgi:flagellar biosynthesis protein FlhB
MKHKQRAVALEYDSSLTAPLVVAKGEGALARRLEEVAREHGIPVVRSLELAERLFVIDTGTFIPEPFYKAVAEVLAFVWRSSDALSDSSNRKKG